MQKIIKISKRLLQWSLYVFWHKNCTYLRGTGWCLHTRWRWIVFKWGRASISLSCLCGETFRILPPSSGSTQCLGFPPAKWVLDTHLTRALWWSSETWACGQQPRDLGAGGGWTGQPASDGVSRTLWSGSQSSGHSEGGRLCWVITDAQNPEQPWPGHSCIFFRDGHSASERVFQHSSMEL